MIAMRDEGKIGAIGISAVEADVVRQALAAGLVCVQNAYSLLDRSQEATLRLCEAEGIAWVPFFPLGSAFPGFPDVADDPVVNEVADEIGATPTQIGLAWLLTHSPNTHTAAGIPGLGGEINGDPVDVRPGCGVVNDRKPRCWMCFRVHDQCSASMWNRILLNTSNWGARNRHPSNPYILRLVRSEAELILLSAKLLAMLVSQSAMIKSAPALSTKSGVSRNPPSTIA